MVNFILGIHLAVLRGPYVVLEIEPWPATCKARASLYNLYGLAEQIVRSTTVNGLGFFFIVHSGLLTV